MSGMQGKSLSIMVPMYGGMCTGTFLESFAALILKLQAYNIPMSYAFVYNESLVTRARNRLVDQYLKSTNHTHSLQIDADIGFNPDDILVMLESDHAVIGAPCVKKDINWDRVQRAVVRANTGNGIPPRALSRDEMLKCAGNYVIIWEKFEGTKTFDLAEMQEVKRIGTGILMVRRDVFLKYQQTYPERWYEARGDPAALPGQIFEFFRAGVNPETRDYDSEDYWFCHDCKEMGYKVYMAPWMRTTHTGTHTYVGDLPTTTTLLGGVID